MKKLKQQVTIESVRKKLFTMTKKERKEWDAWKKKQEAFWKIREQFETVYSEDEVRKLIKAFEIKHKYSCNDKIPYIPKPSKIIKGQI